MVRSKLQYCKSCDLYGLGPDCDVCGKVMVTSAPLKYSPEDPQGKRRRERENAGSDEWVESLPSPNEEAER
ncbi:MAG: nucleolar RNA-binding Nop10p family protein [Candidatus Thermoplasmatota archaeon]|jgi:rRNA maturation protein Nop10|nr:nucleolar RNA-binding Nop10p family protein [Candidatus Thermoplasmatota archaeon]MEC7532200.1 nucleolar RNA-binding Nop10p family protein [Candidatus Thermoplasmatota archaeon]MEC9146471.1 nucleolar RNA-binding Nop10p family protein [Candidatus Thermoplasmatota archaeon]MEE2625654.1 nucleolar RNA-binding Nop10p family protein [Candidatus Thermoplasmatota archaeon]|tara:strand:- start:9520 stop:9732 length:213 start_codon:yes stop_codon:yes gene_type:complete